MDDYSRAQRALNTEVSACKEDYAQVQTLAGSRTAEDIENAVTAKKAPHTLDPSHTAKMPTLTACVPAEFRTEDEECREASH
jgi:hypothetical protein